MASGNVFATSFAAMLRSTPFPEDWRFLDDLAGAKAAGVRGTSNYSTYERKGWTEEANWIDCVKRFVASVGGAWQYNLTASTEHLYRQQFRKLCPCVAEHSRVLPYDTGC